MKYRRPQNFEAVLELLENLKTCPTQGLAKRLQGGICRLFELNWFNDAIKPLYTANVVVQMVMNSLVPLVQELIIEPDTFATLEAKLTDTKAERYTLEFNRMLDDMKAAAPLRTSRTVTAEFEGMAAAMELYANDASIQEVLCHVYCCSKSARTAFKLVNSRIIVALSSHCEILKSDDVPLDALGL